MSEVPPPPAQPAPVAANPNQAGAWAHLGLILSFIVPLIIWLVGKDTNPVTNREGKEALNAGIWQAIYLVAYQIVNAILLVVTLGFWGLIGWIPPVALWVFIIVFGIQGFQKVNAGGAFTWPKWLNPVALVK